MIDEERQRFARRLRERDAEIERLRAIIYKNCDPLTATPEEIVAALAAAEPKP